MNLMCPTSDFLSSLSSFVLLAHYLRLLPIKLHSMYPILIVLQYVVLFQCSLYFIKRGESDTRQEANDLRSRGTGVRQQGHPVSFLISVCLHDWAN